MTTIREALRAGAARLSAAGIDGAARDMRRLAAAALEIPADRLTLVERDLMPPEAAARLDEMVAQRLARMPVSRIIGWRDFHGRRFRIGPEVLDPRPETETLVDLALAQPFSRMLDLGTGSGCIAITLLAEMPGALGVGTDIDPGALAIAAHNARLHGVESRLRLLRSDWFAGLDGRFDLIVSNPPYIAAGEMAALAPEVADHDPRHALTDEGDGLTAYRAIAAGLAAQLTPGGRVLLEIGPTQGAAVAAMLSAAGLADVAVHPDLDGRDRVVVARAPH